MKKLLILLVLFSINALAEPVNINKADAKTISQSLKGIGIIKANAIVKYRKKNGPFKTLNDLTNVPGVGKKIVKKNARNLNLSGSVGGKKSKVTKGATKTKAKKVVNKKAKSKKSKAKKTDKKKAKKKAKNKKTKAKKAK